MSKTIILENHTQLSELAAKRIVSCMKRKPDAVLCLAGGNTPLETYKILIEKVVEENLDLQQVTFVSLDEWVGLNGEDRGSCRYTLNEHLFAPLHIDEQQIVFFDGKAKSMEGECNRVKNIIQDLGGIDLILLGIGENGHIGFNEPHVSLEEAVHIVELDEVTKKVSNKYFDYPVNVSKGITLGMSLILATKEIITIASGKNKAGIVNEIINGPLSAEVPASLLRGFDNVEFIFDSEAIREYTF
jgi:glucosamine-6-phosphate isomerase